MITLFINRILRHNSIKTSILALTLSIMFFPSFVSAADVVSIQSINIKPYNEVLKGFKDTCNCSVDQLVISKLQMSAVQSKITKAAPNLILTIGMDAYNKIKAFNHHPTIYSMILDPAKIVAEDSKSTGVSMSISPDSQLQAIKNVLPQIKKIGLLYHPAGTGEFVLKAKRAADANGITLVAKEVYDSREVPDLLRSINNKIDAFWMIPDMTVVTPETIQFILLYSFQNNIPVITFSDKYVEMGALMSLEIDPYDIGKQAGEMARKFLSGTDMNQIARTDARNSKLTLNMITAEKLARTIKSEIQKEAKIITRE